MYSPNAYCVQWWENNESLKINTVLNFCDFSQEMFSTAVMTGINTKI